MTLLCTQNNNNVYRILSPFVAFLLHVWWEYAPHASVGYIEGVFNTSHYGACKFVFGREPLLSDSSTLTRGDPPV